MRKLEVEKKRKISRVAFLLSTSSAWNYRSELTLGQLLLLSRLPIGSEEHRCRTESQEMYSPLHNDGEYAFEYARSDGNWKFWNRWSCGAVLSHWILPF